MNVYRSGCMYVAVIILLWLTGCNHSQPMTLAFTDSISGESINGAVTVRRVTRTPGAILDELEVDVQRYTDVRKIPPVRLGLSQSLFLYVDGYETAALQLAEPGGTEVFVESPYRPAARTSILEMADEAYRMHRDRAARIRTGIDGTIRVPLRKKPD